MKAKPKMPADPRFKGATPVKLVKALGKEKSKRNKKKGRIVK